MRSGTLETVEILDLRHYTSADLRPLLDREAEVWAERMTWDYRSSADMILRYIDSKILPGYTAIENGRVVGYSFFVYEGSKGVIGDLFVSANGAPLIDSEHDNAVRSRLATHVIETLQQTPGVHRVEAQLLVHQSGSVSEPFVKEGFRVFPRLFMELPLATAHEACDVPLPAMPDIEIRNWAESDFQSAAHLITAAYLGHIDSEINDQYRTVGGSLRFLNNIVRFPGCGVFDASSSLVAVSRVSGALVGLLLCSRVRDDVGHVTQVCLLQEHRGRGLGKALMMHCCRQLRRRNFAELSLTVTQANFPAVDLYKRLGFETSRVFDAFVWEG
jgi:ribosomal protein S18 acetylase RimI-like enzyme